MKKIVWVCCLIALLPLTSCASQSDGAVGTKSSQASTKQTSSSQSSEKTDESSSEVENYDALIKEAKELNLDGKFKESELKLALIPVSILEKENYVALKETVTSLSASNNKGLQEQKEEEKKKETEEKKPSQAVVVVPDTSTSDFGGDLAKWANTYIFYYLQSDQKQSRLTISGNGAVTQSNYDGTQYFGTASIASDATSVLSYNTDAMYPSTMPVTKTINSNVKIVIQWENGGGSQVFYGYLSQSSRLVLTDGIRQNSGIHEVWVTY